MLSGLSLAAFRAGTLTSSLSPSVVRSTAAFGVGVGFAFRVERKTVLKDSK
jgi:hypothetical protein